jgi:hypothetical protein
MIIYDLIEGDAYARRIAFRAKTCFIMTQMEKPLPKVVESIRRTLKRCLTANGMQDIDAGHDITGKDFLD